MFNLKCTTSTPNPIVATTCLLVENLKALLEVEVRSISRSIYAYIYIYMCVCVCVYVCVCVCVCVGGCMRGLRFVVFGL
ncbi:hypothetical protein ACSBR2_027229 [Camellia fascicularis]